MPALLVLIVAIAIRHFAHPLELLNKYSAAITAAATVVVAAFTGTLYISSIQQSRLTRATIRTTELSNERQVRAYVLCERGSVFNVAPLLPGQNAPNTPQFNPANGPIAQITITNCGQTPAYNVEHWGAIDIGPNLHEPQLSGRDPNLAPTLSTVGPRITTTKNVRHRVLTVEEVRGLRDGSLAIFVHGEIKYEDVFRKKHWTIYRVRHHLSSHSIGISTELEFCEHGNDADRD